jgi:hypothetical protein
MSAFAAIATSEADFPLSTTSGQSESVAPTMMNERLRQPVIKTSARRG